MQPAAPAPRMENFFKLAIWAALYLIPITRALTPHIDYDVWWHLRTGEDIVQQHHVPSTDTFSRHGLETAKPWLAYSWLFEVMLYGVYQILGLPGIIVLRLLLVLAVAVALHRFIARREARFPIAAALFATALLALDSLMSERPWLFTILFSTLLLDFLLEPHDATGLYRGDSRSFLLWLLPLMFALWANLHIQFVYGLLILGIACISRLADHYLGVRPATSTIGNKRWWQLILLTCLCFLATLINPYGIKLYEVVLDYGTHQAPLDIVTELRPLEFRGFRDFIMPALAALAFFALGRRKQWSSFDVLLLIIAGWFSLRMRRDVWFMTLAALGVLVAQTQASSTTASTSGEHAFLPGRRQGLILSAILLALTSIVWCMRLAPNTIDSRLREDYPVEAIHFVKARGFSGPVYNTFDWGGYLIWNLRELPVSMDGRTNLHGDARLTQAYVTWSGLPGWDRDPDLLHSAIVIEDAEAPVTTTMRADPRFKLLHEDQRAVVFEVVGVQ